jgi:hypothetical protein
LIPALKLPALAIRPEVTNLGLSSLGLSLFSSLSPGARHRHLVAAQPHLTPILPYVAVDKDALPSHPAHAAGCIKSFRLPTQAKVSRVSFRAQYQAFVRFAVGKQRSSLSHRAQVDLRFGTFHSGRVLA